MASSKDFEKIWGNYQEVIKTKDVSIVDYCQRNGIVYSQFQRWYKKHVSGVSIVPVSGSDVLGDMNLSPVTPVMFPAICHLSILIKN